MSWTKISHVKFMYNLRFFITKVPQRRGFKRRFVIRAGASIQAVQHVSPLGACLFKLHTWWKKGFYHSNNRDSYKNHFHCYMQGPFHCPHYILSNPLSTTVSLLGEGNGTPLQYSCLENPMDGGAWKAADHRVSKSRTRLSDFTFTFHFHALEKDMATHSSVLPWRIPGTGEPGGPPSTG